MTDDIATLRRDLAAAYRLAALFGWDDTLYTHFSVRLPGAEPRFLINPFGLLFEEVRASDLIVVDMQGKVVEGNAEYNVAGFTVHSAVHMARDDAHCVIHTHTLVGMAVAALDLDERIRIQTSLANNIALILRHQGLLSVGASVADAFCVMFYLNRACEIQLATTASACSYSLVPDHLSRHACEQLQGAEWQRQLIWKAWLRKLDRLDPSYKD